MFCNCGLFRVTSLILLFYKYVTQMHVRKLSSVCQLNIILHIDACIHPIIVKLDRFCQYKEPY